MKKREAPILSFQWDVLDYNAKTQEYTIKNRVTGETRTMPKELYLELREEQKKGAKK
jgi:hypothetical protein